MILRRTVYLISPLRNGNQLENIKRSIDVSFKLMCYGFAPVNPLLYTTMYSHSIVGMPEEDYHEVVKSILAGCDYVLRINPKLEGDGSAEELIIARKLNIPIFDDLSALIPIEANYKI